MRRIQDAGSALTLTGIVVALLALASIARLSARHRALSKREREARAEAERRREALERLSASRERLLHGFSHDVKNPLGAADGYLFMLEHTSAPSLTPQQRTRIAKSRGSLRTALLLIEDLIEVARTETGEIQLRLGPLDLCQIVERIAEEYGAQAERRDSRSTCNAARRCRAWPQTQTGSLRSSRIS